MTDKEKAERLAWALDAVQSVQIKLWGETARDSGEHVFSPEKEWSADTLQDVAESLEACGFAPGGEYGPGDLDGRGGLPAVA